MELTTVSPETLDEVWRKWREENSIPTDIWERSYTHVTRRFGLAKKFEEWLFTEGAIVQQIKGKRHLQFMDENQASYFLLRYA
jgi:hypothetical protein